MVVIREFETMLNLIKTTNEYNGIPYNHPGPAHLSIGQEASAVGMAYTLGVEDFIFGSHAVTERFSQKDYLLFTDLTMTHFIQ